MFPRFSRNVCTLVLSVALLACTAAPLRAADNYSIDGAHSFVMFRVNHLGIGESYGRFNEISGTFDVDGGTPTSLSFQINAQSVDTADEDRDKHLKSPDFFNTKQFPVIKFESKSIKKHGDHFEVAGDLAMLGVTKPFSFDVSHTGEGKDPWGNFRTGWHSEFTVKRSDYGMKFMLEGLSDEVAVVVSIEGIKK
jgi:polyisoprenoid-binding protein YceI